MFTHLIIVGALTLAALSLFSLARWCNRRGMRVGALGAFEKDALSASIDMPVIVPTPTPPPPTPTPMPVVALFEGGPDVPDPAEVTRLMRATLEGNYEGSEHGFVLAEVLQKAGAPEIKFPLNRTRIAAWESGRTSQQGKELPAGIVRFEMDGVGPDAGARTACVVLASALDSESHKYIHIKAVSCDPEGDSSLDHWKTDMAYSKTLGSATKTN